MRRWMCFLLMLCLTLAPLCGHALEEEDSVLTCREDRAECVLLQMAMAGSFDAYDPDDTLRMRVLASVYPKLCAVSEEDIGHCAEERQVEESTVRLSLYRALKNALWANLICDRIPSGKIDSAGGILLLFIDPASQENADYQMEQIRQHMTDAALQALAESANTPLAFIDWLIQGG